MSIICSFSELNISDQTKALNAIEDINKKTSTAKGRTWENYTESIKTRIENCPNSRETLLLAQKIDRFVGYAAFYTSTDRLWCTENLKPGQAYCSWTAVDPEYYRQGIATDLKSKILDSDQITSMNLS